MQVFRLPQGVIDKIVTFTRKFFWRGKQLFMGGHCLVCWGMLALPKKELGIMDLRAQNDALLLRWLWTIHAEPNSLWHRKISLQLGVQLIQDLSNIPAVRYPYSAPVPQR
jgi:hypothetical protein